MKIRLSILLLALSLSSSLFTALADENVKPEKKSELTETTVDLQKQITAALEKSGLDAKSIQEITSSLEKNGSGSVSVQTTIIGPDGKVTTSQETNSTIPDLNKLLSEATKMAKEATEKAIKTKDGKTETTVTTSVSGKVIVVGPDGKTEMHEMGDENQNAAFQKALSEALSKIDLDSLQGLSIETSPQVFEFGPAIVQSNEIEERLTSLEKEIQAQKKLLEKILKKLE